MAKCEGESFEKITEVHVKYQIKENYNYYEFSFFFKNLNILECQGPKTGNDLIKFQKFKGIIGHVVCGISRGVLTKIGM